MSHDYCMAVIGEMAETVRFFAYDFNKEGQELAAEFLDTYAEFGFPRIGEA